MAEKIEGYRPAQETTTEIRMDLGELIDKEKAKMKADAEIQADVRLDNKPVEAPFDARQNTEVRAVEQGEFEPSGEKAAQMEKRQADQVRSLENVQLTNRLNENINRPEQVFNQIKNGDSRGITKQDVKDLEMVVDIVSGNRKADAEMVRLAKTALENMNFKTAKMERDARQASVETNLRPVSKEDVTNRHAQEWNPSKIFPKKAA